MPGYNWEGKHGRGGGGGGGAYNQDFMVYRLGFHEVGMDVYGRFAGTK